MPVSLSNISPQQLDLTLQSANGLTFASSTFTVETAGLYLLSGNASGLADNPQVAGVLTIRASASDANWVTASSSAGEDGVEVNVSASRVVRLAVGDTIGLYAFVDETVATNDWFLFDYSLSAVYLGP